MRVTNGVISVLLKALGIVNVNLVIDKLEGDHDVIVVGHAADGFGIYCDERRTWCYV